MTEPRASLPLGMRVTDPGPRARPAHGPLEGRGISLVPMVPERDCAALFEVSHGTPETEELWTYMPRGPFESEGDLCDWYSTLAESSDVLFYTVVDAEDRSPCGVTSFLAIEPTHGSIEIGHIWYAPDRQRTSANTEACLLLLGEAFDQLGYRRMEWKCDACNAPSRAAALRLGFQYEGLFRQHRIVDGRNRDTAWYSILDSEWPALRSAMKCWLEWDDSQGPRPALSDR